MTPNMQDGFHDVNLQLFALLPAAKGSTTVLPPQIGDVETTCRQGAVLPALGVNRPCHMGKRMPGFAAVY
jgi:hypothetical protein